MTVPGALLVTGGGRGIGAATARLAAERGYVVAVNYAKDATAAERVVADIRDNCGAAIAVQADVSVEADVMRLFATVEREFGTLHALVNNAGITGGFGRVSELSADVVERVFAVNVIGAFLCAREAVRRMSTLAGGEGGAIVNVSSRAARLGGPGEWVHYASSKGALDSLTVGLAREVAGEGIRVNGVAAGLIDTDLHAEAGKPTRARDLASGIPLRRAGTASEVAEAILWLLSPAASYVTGATTAVAGGR
ncbi:SDR family oxidoreductase [Pseudonocardia sp. TRM90224]|uniref:SDR family oxidoreductase n=1 Tax=Pseudonocardia sp. TRM90224 TaxID=2812678 RepID=UPI001E3BC2B1|nr:SDR family oxidoreductase [Pseudonocardia sp. TRM90224]